MWTAPPVAGRSGWGGAYRGDFSLAISEDRVDNLARFFSALALQVGEKMRAGSFVGGTLRMGTGNEDTKVTQEELKNPSRKRLSILSLGSSTLGYGGGL